MEDKFLAAYDKYSKNILRHIYFRVSDEKVAEDLTAEVFLKAWRYIANGEEVLNFKAFLYRIANNLIIDFYRTRKENLSLEALEEDNEIAIEEKNVFQSICDEDLTACALKELDTETRQIIMFRYIDDLSVKEISEVTNKTTNNISVIIHRGLKKLKEIINNF
ncbi:hypothetical protein A2645_01430 [Candidatus Nomurabacteria bacterium RIFCSPHIGHO2_01_FULL_39_9]|uniref:RNA polymerase sigma factor n=1 Tax=Candidatus Nomurabacteria bacterium RIFCSPHIGHO2_01_FULL_39_9 TaxID=1801735 RepID=A0A1F6UXU8_9BACT|nr:MAG: hypothetical protein A2645_01430 [Candidatus Nomurabacteria bacterium RIFCSPHIGHO2_01_FULL_39_9]